VRNTWRNPQKSPADLVLDPKKIIKERKTSEKGASELDKPKQSYAYLQERLRIEQIHVKNLASSTSSEEKFSEIHKAPYSLGSRFSLSPKETSPPAHHIPLVLSVTPQLSII